MLLPNNHQICLPLTPTINENYKNQYCRVYLYYHRLPSLLAPCVSFLSVNPLPSDPLTTFHQAVRLIMEVFSATVGYFPQQIWDNSSALISSNLSWHNIYLSSIQCLANCISLGQGFSNFSNHGNGWMKMQTEQSPLCSSTISQAFCNKELALR